MRDNAVKKFRRAIVATDNRRQVSTGKIAIANQYDERRGAGSGLEHGGKRLQPLDPATELGRL
jgi:hypothetical protein